MIERQPKNVAGVLEFEDYTDLTPSQMFDFTQQFGDDTLKEAILKTAHTEALLNRFIELTGINIAPILSQTPIETIISNVDSYSYFSIRQFLSYCYWYAELMAKKWEFISEVGGYDIIEEMLIENYDKTGYVLVTANEDFTINKDTPIFLNGVADMSGEYWDITRHEEIEEQIEKHNNLGILYELKVYFVIYRFVADTSLIPVKFTRVILLRK